LASDYGCNTNIISLHVSATSDTHPSEYMYSVYLRRRRRLEHGFWICNSCLSSEGN